MQQAITTERLILRRWRDSDHEPFRQLNADPRVMDFMPAVLGPEATDRMLDRIGRHFDRHGFGLFAAELRQHKIFLGFIGLSVPNFEAAFTPAVEIGWRLAANHWGRGLATEGARAVLRHGFEVVGLPSVVSFTVPGNIRSRRVMEKLGMMHDPSDDFEHPNLPIGHPLRPHVLYRLTREAWLQSQIKGASTQP
jgi:RimJ/RimL family protein N-acetyltransferase